MKIKVYGKEYTEQVRKFESFIIDSEKYPELEPEGQAIVLAHSDGTRPKDMDQLMESLIRKMWETDVKIDDNHTMSLAECFEPFEQIDWEKTKNDESWLECEGVIGNAHTSSSEITRPRWFSDDLADDEN